MPVRQPDAAVHIAALPIAIAIDSMVATLPADADLAEIAADLVYELALMCERRELIEIFTEALGARRTLIQLGIQL
jgi:hypothetical protein